jgi:septal ring-binding cell division protein DamX
VLFRSDGSIVVAIGPDIVLLDPQTLLGRRTVRGGASDFWIPLRWNGFRPRAPGLDQPVTFPGAPPDTGDSILAAIRRSQADTSLHAPVAANSSVTRRPVLDSAQGRLAPAARPAATPAATPAEPGYTVQFAALLNQDSARARAAHITAAGRTARVVATPRGSATVYLVVLGPFASRTEAEAAARASKQPNPWVYEGAP